MLYAQTPSMGVFFLSSEMLLLAALEDHSRQKQPQYEIRSHVQHSHVKLCGFLGHSRPRHKPETFFQQGRSNGFSAGTAHFECRHPHRPSQGPVSKRLRFLAALETAFSPFPGSAPHHIYMSIPFPRAPASPKTPARAIRRCSSDPKCLLWAESCQPGSTLDLGFTACAVQPETNHMAVGKTSRPAGLCRRTARDGVRAEEEMQTPQPHRTRPGHHPPSRGDASVTAHGMCDTRPVESP